MSAGDFPPPLKPGTIAKKRRMGYPETTLTATGALRRHMVSGVNKDEGAFIRPSSAEYWYAAVQMFGSGRVPARARFAVDEPQVLKTFWEGHQGAIERADAVFR